MLLWLLLLCMIWFCKHLARTEDLLAPPFEQPERSQPQGRTQGDSLAVWVCKGRCSDFFAGGVVFKYRFQFFQKTDSSYTLCILPTWHLSRSVVKFWLVPRPMWCLAEAVRKKHHTPYIGPYIMTQSCLITGRRRWVYLILDLRCFCGQWRSV